MITKIVSRGLLTGMIIISLTGLSQDSCWEIEQVTYDVTSDGSKANTTKQTIYVGKNSVRIENKEGITLFKIEGDSAYIVRLLPQQKTYMILPSQFLVMSMLGTYFKCNDTGCEVDTTAIQPTGEIDTVKGYKAQKIRANLKLMGVQTMPMFQWMTKDWDKLNEAMKAYWKILKEVMLMNAQDTEEAQLMKKVFEYIDKIQAKYGNTIKSEVSIWNTTTITETVSVSMISISEDMFTIPKDYQQMEGFMQFRK